MYVGTFQPSKWLGGGKKEFSDKTSFSFLGEFPGEKGLERSSAAAGTGAGLLWPHGSGPDRRCRRRRYGGRGAERSPRWKGRGAGWGAGDRARLVRFMDGSRLA